MRTRTILLTLGLGAATLISCGSEAGVEQGRSDDATTEQASDSSSDPTTETSAAPTTGVESTDVDSTEGDSTDVGTSDVGTSDVETSDVETSDAPTTMATTDPATDQTDVTTEGPTEVECPNEDGSSAPVGQFPAPPPMCIDPTRTYTATMSTNIGPITLTLDPEAAPMTVNSFVFLAGYHYFDNTTCHRIIPGFVIQCGDPTATGTGGPGYEFPDELPAAGEYRIGSLAMANAGPDTNGSQFFIITGEAGASLSPDYSLFGEVTAGLDVVGAIDGLGTDSGDPISPVDIESMTITVK